MAVGLRRPPVVRVGVTARAHDCGPEPSLRTSPSSSSSRPTALPSDSLGRIEVARRHAHPDDGLLPSWFDALLGCALATSAAGPAEWRPRGRPYSAYAWVVVCAVVAFANVRELFANGPPHGFWGVEGWRASATDLRVPTRRAPPRRSSTGGRASRDGGWLKRGKPSRKPKVRPYAKRTPRRRPATRKPPKAARATGRAPASQASKEPTPANKKTKPIPSTTIPRTSTAAPT